MTTNHTRGLSPLVLVPLVPLVRVPGNWPLPWVPSVVRPQTQTPELFEHRQWQARNYLPIAGKYLTSSWVGRLTIPLTCGNAPKTVGALARALVRAGGAGR